MPPDPTNPTPPAAPAAPAPPAEPAAAASESQTEKLLKAYSSELAALRSRLDGVPDLDELAALREKASRFDQLQQELPQWEESLTREVSLDNQRLKEQLETEKEKLDRLAFERDSQAAFIEAGGRPEFFEAIRELFVNKHATRNEAGAVVVTGPDGASIPLAQALASVRGDAVLGTFFHPQRGAGAGSRNGRDGRHVQVADRTQRSVSQAFRDRFSPTNNR